MNFTTNVKRISVRKTGPSWLLKFLILFSIAQLISEAQTTHAQTSTAVRLNPAPCSTNSSVDYAVSNDGQFVVYRSDQDICGVTDLYSVATSGGPVFKLNSGLGTGGEVQSFAISSDSRFVVFISRAGDQYNLFSVPTGGGPAVRLNPNLPNFSVIDNRFQISPDGTRVVFSIYTFGGSESEIYSAPIAGTGATRISNRSINGPLGPLVYISKNSQWVFFRTRSGLGLKSVLYSTPLGGGAINQLAGADAVGFGVREFVGTTESGHVVFKADLEESVQIELYSAPSQGGPLVKLNEPLSPEFNFVSVAKLAPDGQRVVYSARHDTDDAFQVYSVPVTGGASTRLTNPSETQGFPTSLFKISADSLMVVVRVDRIDGDKQEVFSIPISGGQNIRLNPPLLPGRRVINFVINSDSKTVAYLADQDRKGFNGVYVVPIGGGKSVKVSEPIVSSSSVNQTFQFSHDGKNLYFYSIQNLFGANELYRYQMSEGLVDKVNNTLINKEFGVRRFELASNNSSHVVFLQGPGGSDIYSSPSEKPEISSDLCTIIATSTERLLPICL